MGFDVGVTDSFCSIASWLWESGDALLFFLVLVSHGPNSILTPSKTF